MVDAVTIFITFIVIIFGYWPLRKRTPKFPPGIVVFGSTIFEMPRGVPSGGSKRGAPLRPKIFSILCSLLENLAFSYVGAPWRVGAPSYRESWIRPWYCGKRIDKLPSPIPPSPRGKCMHQPTFSQTHKIGNNDISVNFVSH